MRFKFISFLILALSLGEIAIVAAPQPEPDFSNLLRWRNIGPHRGGRVRAISGVPLQPNVFYMAQVNGGVFRTNDYGRTWQPIFDDQPTGSVGALAVSVSNPEVIYVGSGEGLHRPDLSVGDGIYKSNDAGKTWAHLGLRDAQQIAQIAVDPRNPDHLLVAVPGHPYGPNEERGIFLSTDGGKIFAKTLYKDENTGAADVQFDPTNPQIAYASLWEAREGPWENAEWNGTNGGIFKSTDGGQTWKPLTKGLPNDVVQAQLAIAPGAPKTLLAAVATLDAGKIFRSDDGGESWTLATTDERPGARIGGGDLPVLRIDPKNPDVVYAASVVCWKSTDGGKTWEGWRGAPGGDDYQNVWINPNDSKIILLASDQGAIVTVNGGETWSSWYNQSTAQLYHVSADNAFPYRLYSGQQESGSVGIASRGPDGAVTFRDWHPVAAQEYGYVVADPLDSDIIYGGKLTRYDRRTGQAQSILPDPFLTDDFRMIRTMPILFSPLDPKLLFFATNHLWQTRNGGQNWTQISPDLTRKTFEIPASVGKFRDRPTAQPRQRGVIYAVAPSPLDKNRIWAGTDDGLIHVTSDGGKTWSDVTPPQVGPWWKISVLEASHFDKNTAYAAVNTIRLDDLRPRIYRTQDGGKTWQEIVNGIPPNENVNVVREDPRRRGLLFAGTERAVYDSFDEGANWRSLRLNMPATSVRDLIVKDDDLAVGTHGRGFWILDNFTPLRQLSPKDEPGLAEASPSGETSFRSSSSKTQLFRPQTALRVRWNFNTDTPLPPDEPAGENPPEGAMIDYSLGVEASGPVTLEIKDGQGKVVRRYASTDPAPTPDPQLKIPRYWVKAPQTLSDKPGLHRFFWDLHGTPFPDAAPEYPMTAVRERTAPQPTAPWVVPGSYSVVLTAAGKSFTQPLAVKTDPRVKATTADLTKQFEFSQRLSDLRAKLQPIGKEFDALVAGLAKAMERVKENPVKEQVAAFRKKLEPFANPAAVRSGGTLELEVLAKVRKLFDDLQEVDAAPTPTQEAAVAKLQTEAQSAEEKWKALAPEVAALESQLADTGVRQ
ncbi:MAG: glycoside hydrolase [Chthoniobacterales bacterium]|nr:glycoside hydrolase [Chthoniobacterales bacterium]